MFNIWNSYDSYKILNAAAVPFTSLFVASNGDAYTLSLLN